MLRECSRTNSWRISATTADEQNNSLHAYLLQWELVLSRQTVGQSELIPCHAARKVWGDRMKGRLVVFYIDSEAAHFALIKGLSPTRGSAWLANEIWTGRGGA